MSTDDTRDTRDDAGDDPRDEPRTDRDERGGDAGNDTRSGGYTGSGGETRRGDDGDGRQDDDQDRPTDRDPIDFDSSTPMLEWVMAGAGALLAVALVVALVMDGMTSRSGPPAFTTTIVEVAERGDTTHLNVEVTNVGDRAVTGVIVRAEQDGTELAEAQVQHLPHGATETIGLLVGPDVPLAEVQVRVVGYLEP